MKPEVKVQEEEYLSEEKVSSKEKKKNNGKIVEIKNESEEEMP